MLSDAVEVMKAIAGYGASFGAFLLLHLDVLAIRHTSPRPRGNATMERAVNMLTLTLSAWTARLTGCTDHDAGLTPRAPLMPGWLLNP
jgi:hypothetical protein